ncbi:hypothetical protein KIPB_004611 [Kipferlia bialata]|uniref:Uncharacterized protein n=1 Tax=Kipferlia bialata TaxID=797122 RepID=A0A9K3GHK5_9EUKA|nr:hypothetical protein KIPB_004611 [Kipferlia bialata]|eukprot:g4611.t1
MRLLVPPIRSAPVTLGQFIGVLPVTDSRRGVTLLLAHDTVSGEDCAWGEVPVGPVTPVDQCSMQVHQHRKGTKMTLSVDPALIYPHPDMRWAVGYY